MQPDRPMRYVKPPVRDDKIPLDVLHRVMPRKPPEDVPRDPTLLEVLTGSFYTEQAKTNQDASDGLKDDGNQR